MIIIKLQGGLGNQLFQYSLGRALAIKNSVDLALDTQWFGKVPNRQYDLGHFNIRAHIATKHEVRSLTGGLLARALHLNKNHVSKILTERSFTFDPQILNAGPNVYVDGYWQSEKYFSSVAENIRKELTIRSKPDRKNQQLLDQMRDKNAISVHIRRGDYVENPGTNRYHGTCSVEYYEKAIDLLLKKVVQPHFYIFSDDVAWAEQNLAFKHPVTFVTHNQACAYEDLRLMSACKYYIIANSTFSWWGAWLSHHQDKIVVAPKLWFNDPETNTSDLVPKEWIRL